MLKRLWLWIRDRLRWRRRPTTPPDDRYPLW